MGVDRVAKGKQSKPATELHLSTMLQSLSRLRPSSSALPGDLTEIFRSSEYEQNVKYGCLHEDMEQQKLSNTLLNNQPNMPIN